MLWNEVMVSITGDGRSLQLVFPRRRLPQFGECRPARSPAQRRPPLIPATAGPFGPSTSSCRSRSLDRTPKHSAGWRDMLHDPPPDKRPWEVLSKYLGQIARTRRNPASQTIILDLSQCSRRARRARRHRLIAPMSHFPVKSGQSRRFRTSRALDRRIARCRHRRGAPQEPDSRLAERPLRRKGS